MYLLYYVGKSVWVSSDGFTTQVCPNFIVRTDKPEWDDIQGMPIGHANHDIVREADEVELEGLPRHLGQNRLGIPPSGG